MCMGLLGGVDEVLGEVTEVLGYVVGGGQMLGGVSKDIRKVLGKVQQSV